MRKSNVDKIREANELIEQKGLSDVEFGGIFSGNDFKIEFLQKDKLYEVKVSKEECRKTVSDLAELISEKIKNEKYEV